MKKAARSRVGYSGKQKKEVLRNRRNKKRLQQEEREHGHHDDDEENVEAEHQTLGGGGEEDSEEEKINKAATKLNELELTVTYSKTGRENKLTSRFVKISDELVAERKKQAMLPLDMSKRNKPLLAPNLPNLGLPKRPVWDANTSPEELLRMEEEGFQKWLEAIYEKYTVEELSPFEHNLEVWRQLWRVVEKSDLVILVADIRNPLLHIPRSFYEYIVDEMKRPMIVALTKIDLASQAHVEEWMAYLKQAFPEVRFVPYSTKAKATDGKGGVAARRKQITSKQTAADREKIAASAKSLLDACLHVWNDINAKRGQQPSQEAYPTVGIIGQPNVGKSSLLNSLFGSKVVSVSRTCGHTKHWQTHLVKDHKDPNKVLLELCDSPGLVFPVVWPRENRNRGQQQQDQSQNVAAPRHIYEVCGLYPIPQIRECFSSIRLIAEHVELERLYNIKLDPEDYGNEWTPYAIAGSLADKRGYTLSRGGGADMHRAGLEIIRDTVDGYILLAFSPPSSP